MISAIFLAAGQSKRLLKENKLLKIYKKKPLICHSLNSLIKSKVNKIIIVLGHESGQVRKVIKTARAKGLTQNQALIKHGIRNALIPVLTIIGLQFSFLMAGAIIIENVFFLPGLGRLIFQSIAQRDIIVVESVIMLLVFSVVIVTFLVDVAYVIVDPRLRSSIL